MYLYLTVILRGRAGYELIYITNEAAGRVGYYQLISGKSVNFQAILNLFHRVKPPQIVTLGTLSNHDEFVDDDESIRTGSGSRTSLTAGKTNT